MAEPIYVVLRAWRLPRPNFLAPRSSRNLSPVINMPRAKKGAGKSRHDPLIVQLDEDEVAAKYGRISEPGKRKKSRRSQSNEEENGEVILLLCHANPYLC